MKILYIIPRFYPFKGGAEENFLNLAKRVAKDPNNQVFVITSKIKFKNEILTSTEIYEGIKIIRLWQPGTALYLGFYPYLLIYLICNKFDVIHTSGIGFFWREFCLIIYKILRPKTKIINTPHGPFISANTKSVFRRIAKKIGDKVLSIYLNYLYNIFIAVNPKQHNWMNSLYKIDKQKVHIIFNGIEQEYIENEIVKHNITDDICITFVGRIEWYKGIQNVLMALSDTNLINKKWKFIIIGRPDNYYGNIKELTQNLKLEKKVEFVLSPTDKERDYILKYKSQIFILPSKWEAFGISLVEAMAKGNVIITTYQNESYDILIKEGITGFVYNFDDIKELTSILVKLLEDYEIRTQIRNYNIFYAKNFTWENSFSKYLSLLNS